LGPGGGEEARGVDVVVVGVAGGGVGVFLVGHVQDAKVT